MPLAQSGGSNVGSSQIIDGEIIDADINAAANINESKLDSNLTRDSEMLPLFEVTAKTIIVNISAAQIDALFASPIELIPAPGAGKINIIDQCVSFYTYGGITYAGADMKGYIKYDGLTPILVTQISDTYGLAASADKIWISPQPSSTSAGGVDATGAVNKAIKLYATQDITTGNGTLKLQIKYRTLTV